MMRKLIETNDGSKTIYSEKLDETYHSVHGAIQEAMHVFIKNGLEFMAHKEPIQVFEMGFGTGLNALLSWIYAEKSNITICYTGIEAYPLEKELLNELKYEELLRNNSAVKFEMLHSVEWGKFHSLDSHFSIHKIHGMIETYGVELDSMDVIYFDAFGSRAQQEMWEIQILEKMYHLLKKDGCLVTYCAKGQVKRDLKTLGFLVETLTGPPGKREMIRALK